ncbi:hypothetical protein T484DRAFT_2681544, partial [Baffinella frigidus]
EKIGTKNPATSRLITNYDHVTNLTTWLRCSTPPPSTLHPTHKQDDAAGRVRERYGLRAANRARSLSRCRAGQLRALVVRPLLVRDRRRPPGRAERGGPWIQNQKAQPRLPERRAQRHPRRLRRRSTSSSQVLSLLPHGGSLAQRLGLTRTPLQDRPARIDIAHARGRRVRPKRHLLAFSCLLHVRRIHVLHLLQGHELRERPYAWVEIREILEMLEYAIALRDSAAPGCGGSGRGGWGGGRGGEE